MTPQRISSEDGAIRHPRPDEYDSLTATERAITESMPVLLFTVLRIDADGSLRRIHSSRPDEYPIGGRKSTASDLTPQWHELCIRRQVPYVGNTPPEVRQAFSDHALIEQLGCGAFINAPVVQDGHTIATLCVLAGPGSYGDVEVAAAQSIAHRSVRAVLDA